MILQVAPDAPALLRYGAAALLFAHVGGGFVGLASGATAMIARKGGRLHRRAGNLFLVSMLVMAGVGAAVAPFLPGRWTNTFAGLFTVYLVSTGWATARRTAGTVGRFERLVLGLPLALILVAILLAVTSGTVGRLAGFGFVFGVAALAGLAVQGDLRMLRAGGIAGTARIARHVWRMSLALVVAAGSFFIGQQQVLPRAVQGSPILALPMLAVLVALVAWMVRLKGNRSGFAFAS